MAKFVYRMQNILNLKTKLETQAKNDFAVANGIVREEEEKLDRLYARRRDYEEHLKDLYTESLSVFDIRETANAIDIMDYQISLQRENLKRARAALELARNALQEAMQERQTQEKLRENAFEVFKEEVKAQESKEIDELVSYRFGQAKED
ncbi:MAG: flagellar export protein FliJ [Lachnospiraceae bacterium]|nr:flagellar export protein FliJ [Lachnospiraceae bacterium]